MRSCGFDDEPHLISLPWRICRELLQVVRIVTALINKYQEKLSKSQENVTITEGKIYTIEANNVMSNNEVERLAKLERAVE
ncbi:hypothetical protein H5410_037766 [Solanum commersonii]|uniref:Uncharacterized protein n=1 Tax=Solanum commersonii TaxID=4109 RepID=A0A9J5YC40_SOLCO|nr:hypothetical protein H5410_037766 [Solanum commersonii]